MCPSLGGMSPALPRGHGTAARLGWGKGLSLRSSCPSCCCWWRAKCWILRLLVGLPTGGRELAGDIRGHERNKAASFGGAGGVRRPSALPTYTARRAKSPSRRGFGAVLSMAWHQGRAVAGQPLTRRWLQAGTYLWPWLLVTMVCICVRAYGSPSTLVPADTASAADAAAGARGGPPPGTHPPIISGQPLERPWLAALTAAHSHGATSGEERRGAGVGTTNAGERRTDWSAIACVRVHARVRELACG